jgi:hypothetical protein
MQAFSAVGAMQGAWQLATGQALSLSEQQLVDCSWNYGNNGCQGGEMEPAIQVRQTLPTSAHVEVPFQAGKDASACVAAPLNQLSYQLCLYFAHQSYPHVRAGG